jgi:hypothetical protein
MPLTLRSGFWQQNSKIKNSFNSKIMNENHKIIAEISPDDESIGYIHMPLKDIEDKKINRTVDISELIENYKGIPIYLDLNANNELIGIEISG